MYDVGIIGAGPAGLTTGIYAKRFGLRAVIFNSETFPSRISEASTIENYPGFKKISGLDLWEKMKSHAESYLKVIPETIDDIKKDGDSFILKSSKDEYRCKSIIFATGVAHKRLDVKGESEFKGRGVSYCAVCDAMFFKNKVVGVVGGENPALWDALYLAEHAKKVYLIHDKERLWGDEILKERIGGNDKIESLLNKEVKEIKGEQMVSGIILEDKVTKDVTELELEGVFIAAGSTPNTGTLPKNSG